MDNKRPDKKLDELLKSRVSNFDAGFESADWSRMECMLDAKPVVRVFPWKPVAGIGVIAGLIGVGILIYNLVPSSHQVPLQENRHLNVSSEQPAPAVIVREPAEKPAMDSGAIHQENDDTHTAIQQATAGNNTNTAVTNVSKSLVKKASKPAADTAKDTKFMIMGNEPIFGDMIDSSKGIIGATKEADETKKKARAKKNLPVGWNDFMLKDVSPDSLRSYRNRNADSANSGN